MITQNSPSEKTKIAFSKAFKALKLAELLRRSAIRKTQGISVSEVFKFLLLLVFQGKNLYRFLTLLSTKVIVSFSRLTRPERVKVFIPDDSFIR